MTIEEANHAVVAHVHRFVCELAGEKSMSAEQAMQFAADLFKDQTFQLWKDMQIARLTGGMH